MRSRSIIIVEDDYGNEIVKVLRALREIGSIEDCFVLDARTADIDAPEVSTLALGAAPELLTSVIASTGTAPDVIRLIQVHVSGVSKANDLDIGQLENELLKLHPHPENHPMMRIRVVADGGCSSGEEDFLPGVTTIFVAPFDSVDPQAAAIPVPTESTSVWLTAETIVSVCGLWSGSNGSAPLDGEDRLVGRSTWVARTFARIVVGPSAIDESAARLIDRMEQSLPSPTGYRRPTDEVESAARVHAWLVENHRDHLVSRPYSPPATRPRRQVGLIDAFAALFGFLGEWFQRRAKETVDGWVEGASRRIEGMAQRMTFGEGSSVIVRIGGAGERIEEIQLKSGRVPSVRDLEAIAASLVDAPLPEDQGWREAVEDVARQSLGAFDGTADCWREGAKVALGDPMLIARDPTRWMETPLRHDRAHRSPREEWLSDLANQLRSRFGSANVGLEVPDEITIVVDVPSEAHIERGSWVVGQCHYLKDSIDGYVPHILIHPREVDPLKIAAVLAHELIHAALPGEGHGELFQVAARAIGLEVENVGESDGVGTPPGPDFVRSVTTILDNLGAYPDEPAPVVQRLYLSLADAADGTWRETIRVSRQLEAAIAEASASDDNGDDESDADRASSPRRVSPGLRWSRVALLLSLGLVFAPLVIPLAAVFAVPWVFGGLVAWLAGAYALGVAAFRQRYRVKGWDTTRLLIDHLDFLISETVRLRRMLLRIELTGRSLGVLVHHPFGYGPMVEPVEVPTVPSDRPLALRIGTLQVPQDPEEALVAVSARTLVQGWLSGTYADIKKRFVEQHETRQRWIRGDEPAPVMVASTSGLEMLLDGEVQSDLRTRFIGLVGEAIATFDGTDFYDLFLEFAETQIDPQAEAEDVEAFLWEIAPDLEDGRFPLATWKYPNEVPEAYRTEIFSERPEAVPPVAQRITWRPLDVSRIKPGVPHVEVFVRTDLQGPAHPSVLASYDADEQADTPVEAVPPHALDLNEGID